MHKVANPATPLLLIDDEEAWLKILAFSLRSEAGFNNLHLCHDSRLVLQRLRSEDYSCVLLDLTMPHISGEELLPMIGEEFPELSVIILSGLNQLETAVKCIKLGACDYFVKTTELDRLITGIHNALRTRELRLENSLLRSQVLNQTPLNPAAFSAILTQDEQLNANFRYLEAVAESMEPILFTGESGTGKELFAQALHQLKPELPWIAVNVAGLDDNVFSDTLFGHTPGAFTGADRKRTGMIEQAADGLLFLDEIGDLSAASQIKLLRLLQEREYFQLGSDRVSHARCRFIVATNQDLPQKIAAGSFRKDLYYRLRSHQIQIPPLRERRDDLPLLLDHFLTEAALEIGKSKPTAPQELVTLLATYAFPGNVRELRAMVYHALSSHQGGILSMHAFREVIGQSVVDQADALNSSASLLNFAEQLPTLKQAAELLIKEAMDRARGNQGIAAGLLGITQSSLSKRLKKMNPSTEKGMQ